ncbi:hypothetical protein [Neisseria sp.]|uniref:hypothetical protein n=1 Tax=Neisseria sp. TaxID=192066 RepID=UPI0035A06100
MKNILSAVFCCFTLAACQSTGKSAQNEFLKLGTESEQVEQLGRNCPKYGGMLLIEKSKYEDAYNLVCREPDGSKSYGYGVGRGR